MLFFISGKRTARIKTFTDNTNFCKSCGSYDLKVKVYKQFFHAFYLPFFPLGDKTAKIYCNVCGEPYRIEAIKEQHANATKNPIFLYTGLILIAGLILLVINASIREQDQKERFVENPKVGDVYTIKKNEDKSTFYYFYRVTEIMGDTVIIYHSHLQYSGFINKFSEDDYFVKDEKMLTTKKELKEMLETGKINGVDRSYGEGTGFNRIK